MEQHPAQPTTVQSFDVVAYLDEHVLNTVEQFRYAMRTDLKPTRKKKDYWRQHLAGAIGALETIRSALK